MIYQDIYTRIKRLFNGSFPEEYQKRKVGGLMDLNIDVLYHDTDEILIALAHNYEQNFDLIPDPDMQIRIFPKVEMAEAMTYQDTYSYREVYPVEQRDGEMVTLVNPQAKVDLNSFLLQWLKNLEDQGFFDPSTVVREEGE